jgi:uracil-DNA glycosylase
MRSVAELIDAVQRAANRASFPVDVEVYERAGRDPKCPILFAGSLDAPVCIIGRDLGRDEVGNGQPLIGAGGRLVRGGICKAAFGAEPSTNDRTFAAALDHALLTNLVPYKPPGNKAYPSAVKDRFRPFLVELLTAHWKGNRVITLGNEAFHWFECYAEPGAVREFWSRDDRYQSEFRCTVEHRFESEHLRKPVIVSPLPHPSPLNARWYRKFPELLAERLARLTPDEP